MVDLGRPDLHLSNGQGCWQFNTVDPALVAPKPWVQYVPFHELHGLRKIQSAPAWLPLTWSLRPAFAPHAAIHKGPEAVQVPGSQSLGADLPKKGLRRSSSWAGATWHTGFLHAKLCWAAREIDMLYTFFLQWAHHGEPVKGLNGRPVCIKLEGWQTWHDLGKRLSMETGLQLPRLKVLLQTGCTLRWTWMPPQSPPLRAMFGNDLAPVLQLEQMATEKAELLQKRDAARQLQKQSCCKRKAAVLHTHPECISDNPDGLLNDYRTLESDGLGCDGSDGTEGSAVMQGLMYEGSEGMET